MNNIETLIFQPMIDNDYDKIILKHNTPVIMMKDNNIVKKDKIITSSDISDLLVPLLHPKEIHTFHKKRLLTTHHYTNETTCFTLHAFSIHGEITCTIQKGKFDIYPKTETIIPEVQIGFRYRKQSSSALETWIVTGITEEFSISFLTNENEFYHEKTLPLLEFLGLLREGILYKEV